MIWKLEIHEKQRARWFPLNNYSNQNTQPSKRTNIRTMLIKIKVNERLNVHYGRINKTRMSWMYGPSSVRRSIYMVWWESAQILIAQTWSFALTYLYINWNGVRNVRKYINCSLLPEEGFI